MRALGMTGYPLQVQYEIMKRSGKEILNSIVWDVALTYGHYNLFDTSLFYSEDQR